MYKQTILHKKEKLIHGGKELLIVTYGLHYIQGNSDAYFTVTGEVWKANKDGKASGNDCIMGGCIHDEILKAFPDMSDIVALHLSDTDGVPTYAVENGWYHNGGTKWQEYKKDILASHLRITPEQADIIHNNCKDKEAFAAVIDSMREGWKEEADRVREKYNLYVQR